MSQITNLIEQGKTVDSNTYQQFINDYTGIRYLIKMTYGSKKMRQRDIDDKLKNGEYFLKDPDLLKQLYYALLQAYKSQKLSPNIQTIISKFAKK